QLLVKEPGGERDDEADRQRGAHSRPVALSLLVDREETITRAVALADRAPTPRAPTAAARRLGLQVLARRAGHALGAVADVRYGRVPVGRRRIRVFLIR